MLEICECVSTRRASILLLGAVTTALCMNSCSTFFAAIRREESKWSTKRFPVFFLRKEAEATWPRLQREGKLPWVKVDWAKWADSDEEDEKGAFDTAGMEEADFSALDEKDVEGSDDRDSILADLDEDIEVETEDDEG
mmetsp:Transcript_19715/g.35924  ORF Transcript_19715/g.35924 Transcript_19715/m.35924 type:complete len:138 (+) Transcript_19715:209-622(+)